MDSSHSWSGLRPIVPAALASEPLVSVLVSCRNYGRFVDECIQSALGQSYARLEIIICDDGSQDDSRTILENWVRKDPRVRLISQPCRGMAAALNAAWRLSAGEILCLLDADDTFYPDKLKMVVEAFRLNPRVGFVANRAMRTDARGSGRGILPLFGILPSGWCLPQLFENAGVLPNLPPTSNLSLRREVADAIFPLPERFTGFAERVIQRLAPLMTELHGIDQPLATWRLHGRNDANGRELRIDTMERDLRNMEDLWDVQKMYLDTISPQLGSRFPSLAHSEYYCRIRYILARLKGSPDAGKYGVELRKASGFPHRPRAERFFWRAARFMPDFVFAAGCNFIMTQGRAKKLLSEFLATI